MANSYNLLSTKEETRFCAGDKVAYEKKYSALSFI